MTPPPLALTPPERARVERIDQLVLDGGVAELVTALSDPSWAVRRAAIAALGALGDDAVRAVCSYLEAVRSTEAGIAAAVDTLSLTPAPGATATVAALLAHASGPVIEDAARVLGRRRAADQVAALAALLAHPSDNVALAAIEAIGAIGAAGATDALIDAVAAKSFFRTFPAMHVLAASGDPRAVAPLAALLDDELYRLEAARALGRTGAATAIAPLAALVRDADAAGVLAVAAALAELLAHAAWAGAAGPVRDAARAALGPHAARFAAVLAGTGDRADQRALLAVLGAVGAAAEWPAILALLDDPAVAEAATAAIQAIARRDEAAVLAGLADPALRAMLLPVATTHRAAPAVAALLADDDADVRARACEALARIGDTASVPALFEMLADANPRVALAAAGAIHALGAAETPRLAIAALGSPRSTVRRHALRVVAYLGCDEALPAVRAALADPDPRVAELAAFALASLSAPEVDGILADLVRSAAEPLRAAAMRAAGLRGGDRMIALLHRGLDDDAAWVRYYAAQGLGAAGRAIAVPDLAARLGDPAPHVRVAAIEALARLDVLDARGAREALMTVARTGDSDERRAALLGLGARADDAGLAMLLDAAAAPEVATRLVALAGLAKHADPRAGEALVAAARGRDPEVAAAALSLLGERTDAASVDALLALAVGEPIAHPAHAALSSPRADRVGRLLERLATASEAEAPVLAAALSRMTLPEAERGLFASLRAPSAAARRAAATVLVGSAAREAHAAVRALAVEDPDPGVREACAALAAERR
ncbi:MAG TPA: HEAT repeat domain-containing protein [Kofleriaceae bacterium]